MTAKRDPFGARAVLDSAAGPVQIHRLSALEKAGLTRIDDLPFTIRVLLENVLRHSDGSVASTDDVKALAGWQGDNLPDHEIPYMPARVVLQDFTGVPGVVDLAAMRSAMTALGGDPAKINPLIPSDLVIDHSVQVDMFGTDYSYLYNVEREFERNGERYALLRWGQKAFNNFSVVPPGTGIVHQVNLEYLARVVVEASVDGTTAVYPDTLVGTDSHTTMINALGVLGWGVGGIEAEAVMLGQPYFMLIPEVVGFKITGDLPEGATATDLVLTVTQILRRRGVVGKFVEFFGSGLSNLTLADRATIANMAPEYGATVGYFPVDQETLNYLSGTGRDAALVETVEQYCKEQQLFRTDATPDPKYSDVIEFDMSQVEPSLAGPRRPQDRISLPEVHDSFRAMLKDYNRPVSEELEPVSEPVGGPSKMEWEGQLQHPETRLPGGGQGGGIGTAVARQSRRRVHLDDGAL
ncbi:MAG: aconitase family protein, partial [Thermaerobacterales bacterium]